MTLPQTTLLRLLLVLVVVPTATASAPTPQSSGPKRTIFLVIKSATSTPRCSNAMVDSAAFFGPNSVAAFLDWSSRGTLSLSGDVVGPFTIPVASTCARAAWATAADAAATASGVKLSAYDTRYYVGPPEADTLCFYTLGTGAEFRIPWRGTVNLPTHRAWVNNSVCDSPHYMAASHGALFGENHAYSGTDEFGDASSVMGGNADLTANYDVIYTSPNFNAPGLITLGWLPANKVQTVTTNGSYRVAYLGATTTDVQALKIHTNGSQANYYFSTRRAVGFDSKLRSQYLDNTSVHSWNGSLSADTYLLSNIGDGQSWSDGKVTVRQTSHDATYAYLAVSFVR